MLDTPEDVRRALGALVDSDVVACFDEGPETVYVIGPDNVPQLPALVDAAQHGGVRGASVEFDLIVAHHQEIEAGVDLTESLHQVVRE